MDFSNTLTSKLRNHKDEYFNAIYVAYNTVHSVKLTSFIIRVLRSIKIVNTLTNKDKVLNFMPPYFNLHIY